METTGTRRISRFSGGKIEEIEDLLAMEEDFVLAANGESVFSASCSPGNSRELAYGALLSRGIIHITDDILSLKVQGERLSVEVRANVPGPVIPIDSSFTLSIESLIAVGRECGDRAVVFRGTGGTHAAALGGSAGIESLFEDISRTCALEKAVGDGLSSSPRGSQRGWWRRLPDVEFRSLLAFLLQRYKRLSLPNGSEFVSAGSSVGNG
jgi:formate dehydrogenase assembly factor FdhD